MSDNMSLSSQKQKPKVAVVIGSGGIKAVSSIPLFEFLEQSQIGVDLLVGCSGGSITASLWAMDHDASRMRNFAGQLWQRQPSQNVEYRTLFSIALLPCTRFDKSHGLIKSRKVHQTLKNLYQNRRIKDLHPCVILQSTDFLFGAPVMLTSGLLSEVVYAFSALYPILPPICREGRWLIDGAFSSPVPIMEAVRNDMDVIIAMSFEERISMEEESNSFFARLMRCLNYQFTWLTRNQRALSIDLHHHEIISINVVFDQHLPINAVDSMPSIIQKGQEALDDKKDQIWAAINAF